MLRNDECIVYLETFEKAGDGIVDAYIDFRQRKDFVLFSRAMGYDNSSATVIELRSLSSAKRLRRGCYYNLNLELLKNYQLTKEEDSLLIGATIDLAAMPVPVDDDTELLQKHEPLDAEKLSMRNVPQNALFGQIQRNDLHLFVKDVDQANWNELRQGEMVKVVYDIGARLKANRQEIERILNSRRPVIERDKPILVISHWDLDHIHCLKYFSENDIKKCFSKIICPDKIKSMTAGDVLVKFRNALGVANVYCLPVPARTNGVTVHHWRSEGCVSIYQGEQSSNVNFAGLLMLVKGGNKSANYTGDCRLAQAKDAYDKERANGIASNEHVLVAPHHGGDYDAKYRQYSLPCDEIAISVGVGNGYGHPHKEMKKYLMTLGSVEMTMDVGDIVKDL